MEVLSGWRRATAGERRTTKDWAHEVGSFREGLHTGCALVALMLDNPTAHRRRACCKALARKT